MSASRIKSGDTVQVMTGKERGKRGKVLQVFPQLQRVVVENLNIMTKNVKSRQEREKGQKIQFASPMNSTNVQLVCGKCNKVTRPGMNTVDGKKIRVCSKCHETL